MPRPSTPFRSLSRGTIAFCSALILLGIFATPVSSQGEVTVGAWNIQYLGAPTCRPAATGGQAQQARDLAKFIIASRVDVLGLEEISDDDGVASTYTNYSLKRVIEVLKDLTGDDWEYMLFRKFVGSTGCKGINIQLTGVMWNTRKATRRSFNRVPIDTSSVPNGLAIWNRPPVVVKFSLGAGKTDFAFVVLHMKSNVGSGTATTREWEAKTLMGQLNFMKNIDRDIVILGDTNVLNAGEAAVNEFVSSGFRDLNSSDMSTSIRSEAFDRIFVIAGQPEFAQSRQNVFGPGYLNWGNAKFLKRLSDHYMVTTKIAVASDDDP